MFADNMKQIMTERGITQAELSKITGIGRSSISQYLSGKNEPTPERKVVIAEGLGVDPEELDRMTVRVPALPPEEKIQRITVEQAAKLLGMNHETVRKGLKQGVFPWGYAIKTSEKQWSYFINAKKFAEVEGVAICR